MSGSNPEENTNPEHNLAPAEIGNLRRLEAVAQHGLETYVEVGDVLAEIRDRRLYRDSHPSFETYMRVRWGVNIPSCDPLLQTTVRGDARATPTELTADELLLRLRWLLNHASGTVAEVAHQLESRASDVDDNARAHLRDDVLVVDDELATVKALLIEAIDWDSEFRRLLEDE